MFDFSTILSIVLYVLQAIGLYTIAKRRNIAHAWLACVPVGSLWIMGSIADDYMARTGKKTKLRIWLAILSVVMVVLLVVSLAGSVSTLMRALSADEIVDIMMDASGMGNDLYAPTEEELMTELTTLLDERLTDQVLEEVLDTMVGVVLASLASAVLALVVAVLEYISLHRVFASCDPVNKTLYLLLSIFVGIGPVFLFICRNKDNGLPQGIPASYEPIN